VPRIKLKGLKIELKITPIEPPNKFEMSKLRFEVLIKGKNHTKLVLTHKEKL
jgi:hypothetical protein